MVSAWGPGETRTLPRSKLVADREEDLPRIAVKSGQHPFPAKGCVKAGDAEGRPGRNAIADILAGIGILRQEVVAGADVFLVGQILAVQAYRPMAAGQLIVRGRVPDGKALLVKSGRGQLEL